MRAVVTVTVDLVAEDGYLAERTLSSVTVTRERLVGVIPASEEAIYFAADAAATTAVANAISGTLATDQAGARA